MDIAEDTSSLLLDMWSHMFPQPQCQEEKDNREVQRGLELDQGDHQPAIEATLLTADDSFVSKSTVLSLSKASTEKVRTEFAVLEALKQLTTRQIVGHRQNHQRRLRRRLRPSDQSLSRTIPNIDQSQHAPSRMSVLSM